MTLPDPTDLATLDRDVARAHAAWTKWQRALAGDPASVEDEAPLDRFRHVAGQTTYEALGRASSGTADGLLRDGLRRWIYALMQARIAQPLDVERAKTVAEASAHVSVPKPHTTSWREAWRGLLGAESVTERGAWLGPIAERAPALAAIERRRAERRLEAESRMRFESGDPLFSTPLAALTEGAEALLAHTDDLARHLLAEARRRAELPNDPPRAIDAIAVSLGRDAPEGWPARLGWAWFDATFGQFARGLRLGTPPLPEALGASSFARACAVFGGALRVAGASPSLPFALAREPEFTAMHRFACVFGALPASAAFQRRILGNVARVADAQARTLTRTLLFASRLEATRFLLAIESAPDAFEERTLRLFGAPLPRALAGAWPTRRDDGRARLAGFLTALPLAKELVDRFDEDWFGNPRAVTHLRALASAPARELEVPGTERGETENDARYFGSAARALAHTFEETLG
jgi:hypothetical protein